MSTAPDAPWNVATDADCGGPIPAFVAAQSGESSFWPNSWCVGMSLLSTVASTTVGRWGVLVTALYRPGPVLEPRYQFRQVRVTVTRLGHRLDGSPTPALIAESGHARRSGAVCECARTLDPYICPASVHVGSAVRGGLRPSKDRFSRGPA